MTPNPVVRIMTAEQWLDKMGEWYIPEPNTGCWLWLGGLNRNGYSQAYGGRRSTHQLAHRLSYELLRGHIPDGLCIDHLCRVRSCVNPDHMDIVTKGENTRRGYGPAGLHHRQTHCLRGHLLAGANLEAPRGKGRVCRECRRLRRLAAKESS